MSNYYNLDGIKTMLKKEITLTDARIKAWENVTFPTKKDGTPFKTMSKNISGATYFMETTAMQAGEYRLRVGDWCNGYGYFSDEICVYELVRYLKDDSKRAKTQNYQPKQQWLEQVYTYDLDDIKQAIVDRIARLKKELTALEKQIQVADTVYNNFKTAYGEMLKQLEVDSMKSDDPTLYYAILDTVKNRYPYC